ncbi:hypothetical protein BHM03_00006847 [Ensete ventricosum]|uniref:PAS domain-containing protein n=1 Tax=Ensete ventricosum TaxID=4639 RepID=A0A426ZGR4_ENSVE|nr:hypothetical protein B296_00021552 [Ensete ventricosum]RZR80772.1 hypothetical protein BHM03_00006847 [Ensete ventricosum]
MDKESATHLPTSSLIPPLPRDSRGSLEIFNPTQPKPRSSHIATWQSRPDPQPSAHRAPPPPAAASGDDDEDIIRPWMALPSTSAAAPLPYLPYAISKKPPAAAEDVGAAAQRAAEWGLVLKTDEETGRPQGVEVRRSGDEAGGKGRSRKSSGGCSYRSSEDSEVAPRGGFPRVSEELREALSAFQQSFVVSDATKSDHPVMYASAGFFHMTGYLAKEVIGRNWYEKSLP